MVIARSLGARLFDSSSGTRLRYNLNIQTASMFAFSLQSYLFLLLLLYQDARTTTRNLDHDRQACQEGTTASWRSWELELERALSPTGSYQLDARE
jgi:hypothetical protein